MPAGELFQEFLAPIPQTLPELSVACDPKHRLLQCRFIVVRDQEPRLAVKELLSHPPDIRCHRGEPELVAFYDASGVRLLVRCEHDRVAGGHCPEHLLLWKLPQEPDR